MGSTGSEGIDGSEPVSWALSNEPMGAEAFGSTDGLAEYLRMV